MGAGSSARVRSGTTQTGELVWVDILGQQVLRHRPGEDRASSLATPMRRRLGRRSTGRRSRRRPRRRVLDDRAGRLAVDEDRARRGGPAGPAVQRRQVRSRRPLPRRARWPMTSARGAGGFYRLDPDGTVEQLLTTSRSRTGSTGRPTAATFYYIDTPTGRIDAFTYDLATGGLSASADAHHPARRRARGARRHDHRHRRRPVGRVVGRLEGRPVRARRRASTRSSRCRPPMSRAACSAAPTWRTSTSRPPGPS